MAVYIKEDTLDVIKPLVYPVAILYKEAHCLQLHVENKI